MQYQANPQTIPQICEWRTSYLDHPQSLGIQPRVHTYPFPRYPFPRYPIPTYPIPRYPIPRYPIPRYPFPRQFSQERCLSTESIHLSSAVFKPVNNEINLPENSFQMDHRSETLCPYNEKKNNSAFSRPYLTNESLLPSNQQFLQGNIVLHPFQHFQCNRMISYQPFEIQSLQRLRVTEQSRNIQVPRTNRSIPQSMSYAGGNLSQREHRGEISDFESESSKHSTFSNQHLANGESLSLIQQDLQENEPIHSTQEHQDNRKIYKELPETSNIQSCPPRFPNQGCFTNIQASCNKQEKPFQCNICKKTFARKSDYKRHKRTHTNERPYQCNICDKRFIQTHHLKVHFRIHKGERPYRCKICHKSFKQGSDLKRHIRAHANRPHQCEICHKRFKFKSILIVHIQTHTKERSYRCNICRKRFALSWTLKHHIRTHTKKGSY